MPISRSRNNQHKVYIPSSARTNHYLLVKFPLTDELISLNNQLIDRTSEQPYQRLYQHLADSFFDVNNKLDIESGQFIANGKFARIRYSPEKLTVQTDEEILFLYSPRNHYSQNTYINGKKRVRVITLVFLANGDDVRQTSAEFHKNVVLALNEFIDVNHINKSTVRVCDHQHFTYDLFSKDKGVTGTQTHKLRTLKNRYAADDISLPDKRDVLTYVVADLPINRRIKELLNIDKSKEQPYQPLYDLISHAFIESANKQHLFEGAILANGLIPIVRSRLEEKHKAAGELQKLSFNPFEPNNNFTLHFAGDCLVDSIQFVIIASEDHKTSQGYGKFLNLAEQALRSTAEKLGYVNSKEELVIRLHQHLGYDL
ncbi:DUF3083 family protein [Colwellia sp. BRX10-4]|uniref:DUF3083 family protein n=1 Tax=Colwellia sp. BRX10-4 TaxID=2759843 RepID=UPI0015F449A6|nr:DUF3083 family protein [Colwellia sp. BRX10-4]MBA6397946.1 DUF3083 family protein [Colwellia sp. BRX10-4]